mgnify:FL=1
MKFKKLYPHPVEHFLATVKDFFDIQFAVINGNGTYLTLVLRF